MQFPSFEEFQSSVSDERLQQIDAQLNHFEIINLEDGITPQNQGALYSRLLKIAQERAITAQLLILAEYHEWLRTNLPD